MVEQWPYEPEKRAKRLGLPDVSEATFQAWLRGAWGDKVGLTVPQVFLDAFKNREWVE